jgi:hypothetical protein
VLHRAWADGEPPRPARSHSRVADVVATLFLQTQERVAASVEAHCLNRPRLSGYAVSGYLLIA